MEKIVRLNDKIRNVFDLVKEINFTYHNLKLDKEVEYDRERKCVNIYVNGVKQYYAISFREDGSISYISPKIETYIFKWLYSFWVCNYEFKFETGEKK